MKRHTYVPDRGDIVWLQFTPQAGHEQAGHRPALVLSPANYNRASGLMICCPMTSQKEGYPFEVVVTDEPDHKSLVLADQVKSLDWKAWRAIKKGSASSNVVAETLSKLHALL
ncbi:endoribonuclease MazF [Nitrospira moscoviensis]|uniref:endoribonuclease MazF n=1 Tax=Nitrospira moscoviensis TaxID=42253 RepID=UPI0006A7F20E|nr:endoribonuclease MazF [Nitrospira moscoviensis]